MESLFVSNKAIISAAGVFIMLHTSSRIKHHHYQNKTQLHQSTLNTQYVTRPAYQTLR